ncbi:uncharacterized protein A4U43_C08F33110 [Asparagus officinalis]|nr:uncharacterized protein A4U43_C08F33110 [Asparagus officinalis]
MALLTNLDNAARPGATRTKSGRSATTAGSCTSAAAAPPSDADGSLRSPSPSPPQAATSRAAELGEKKILLSLRGKYGKSYHSGAALLHFTLITEPPPPPPNSPLHQLFYRMHAHPSAEIEELLLLQVEAQESAIGKARELCDYVDAVCDAEEERAGEVLVDLPVWGSPRCLVAALMSSSL